MGKNNRSTLRSKRLFQKTALALLVSGAAMLSASAESTTTQTIPATQTLQNQQLSNAQITTTPNNKHIWNLQNADLLSVINEVSRETGKSFLVDSRVKGKVNIVSTQPLSPSEVYQMFLSILQVQGFAAVPSGKVIKIVPNMSAKQYNTPVASSNKPGQGDEVVVRVIPVINVPASQLVPILRPLLPSWGDITAYIPSNSIILAGGATNIQRLVSIIHKLDIANTKGIDIMHVRNASASKLVNVISALQRADTGSNKISQAHLAADDASNSILISGDDAGRSKMRALIARLDSPIPKGSTGNTEVIYLKYLNAKKFAPILSKLMGNATATPTGAKDGSDAGALITQPAPGAHGKSKVNVVAEPSTNALILTGPPTEIRDLKVIINRLDIRPGQVLVEAAIVEVDESTINQLGIQWGTIDDSVDTTDDGLDDGTSNVSSTGFGSENGAGVAVIKSHGMAAVINALEGDSSTNLLSTPNIVVMDNQKAHIRVGQTISIQTGSYASTDSSQTAEPFNTTSRDKIGLTLDVTPHINQGQSVELTIKQSNETLENPTDPGLTPATNDNDVNTTVMVNTGDILVLGGLISNDLEEGSSKIPVLGDLPFVGQFFSYKTHQVTKKNLMIFIRPVIIRNSKTSSAATQTKYNFIRNQQVRWENGEKPNQYTSDRTLPAWGKPPALPVPFATQTMVKK